MRLGARVGRACAVLHDVMVRDLPINLIELDELWSYVGKKQRRVLPTDSSEFGDQYVFIAFDAMNKAIISYQVGKRNGEDTDAFARDLRARVTGKPQISSDAWPAYLPAIGHAFGGKNGADYGQIIKSYEGEPSKDAARRYSPGWVVDVEKRVMFGRPRPFGNPGNASDGDRPDGSAVEHCRSDGCGGSGGASGARTAAGAC